MLLMYKLDIFSVKKRFEKGSTEGFCLSLLKRLCEHIFEYSLCTQRFPAMHSLLWLTLLDLARIVRAIYNILKNTHSFSRKELDVKVDAFLMSLW